MPAVPPPSVYEVGGPSTAAAEGQSFPLPAPGLPIVSMLINISRYQSFLAQPRSPSFVGFKDVPACFTVNLGCARMCDLSRGNPPKTNFSLQNLFALRLPEDVVNRILQVFLDLQHFKSSLLSLQQLFFKALPQSIISATLTILYIKS
ncbi:hypothetical protein Tco_1255380 [Tanacetum coccineum]